MIQIIWINSKQKQKFDKNEKENSRNTYTNVHTNNQIYYITLTPNIPLYACWKHNSFYFYCFFFLLFTSFRFVCIFVCVKMNQCIQASRLHIAKSSITLFITLIHIYIHICMYKFNQFKNIEISFQKIREKQNNKNLFSSIHFILLI